MPARVKKMRKDKKERRQKERLQEREGEREGMELISEEKREKGRQNIYVDGWVDVFAEENSG